jgi:endonuclease III
MVRKAPADLGDEVAPLGLGAEQVLPHGVRHTFIVVGAAGAKAQPQHRPRPIISGRSQTFGFDRPHLHVEKTNQRPIRSSAFTGQARLDFAEPESTALHVHRRLLATYGGYLAPLHDRLAPLDQMLRSILGSKTRTEVSWAAFVRLRTQFEGDWHLLARARPDEILPVIGDVTHAEVKAPQMIEALRWIGRKRAGDLGLEFLGAYTSDAARAWLERINGVGPKISASVVNLSTLAMPALVVDSHHHRVAQRIGLISARTTAEAAHALLPQQLPATWSAARFEQHHALFKAHGQVLCRHDRPNCAPCPLNDRCAFARSR